MKAIRSPHKYISLSFLTVIALLLALTGCIMPDAPSNLEPQLSIDSISNVTRTEASANIHIQYRGSATFDHIYLCIAQNTKSDKTEKNTNFARIEINQSSPTVKLTQLRPGTAYLCYLVGETATAKLESNLAEFQTIPNNPPTLAGCTILSHGPTGALLEVEILDDGGDPLEAITYNCRNLNTGEIITDSIINPDLSDMPKVRFSIKNLKPCSCYSVSYAARNKNGATIGTPFELQTGDTYIVSEPGTLSKQIDPSSPFTEKTLTIHGPIDSDDVALLRLLLLSPVTTFDAEKGYKPVSALENLDLTECNIVTGKRTYDNEHFTVENEITTGMFGNCPQLRSIRLPSSATHLRRDAFRGSENLERIEVSVETESIEVSQLCPALQAIDVSKGNRWYCSIDGVLFNADASAILWLPLGKTDPLHIPSTISAIGELAFAGSKIQRFYLPANLKTLGRYAFSNTAITEIEIPDKVTTIPEGTFQNCSALKKVTLGKGMEYVGAYAFASAPVSDIYITAELPPVVATYGFTSGQGSITSTCTLHVPAASISIYRNHARWGKFFRIVSI